MQSMLIVAFERCLKLEYDVMFRPSAGLDHALKVACDLTQILAEVDAGSSYP